ncbi:DNA photolyase [Operophtera brumata nucleopolyhedrovirus]|uniref:Deoxyribodipyrimidine photo-lyase n=1 Tax=Operophtera brumata nucleopolyhedrovirus TaxID=1046267 RepID=A0A2H4UZU5_9ABAC|nr:DNA photolyase [Operophtera brumata nucleopolyhedrovirus]AUA60323.1 DNA photolyase [Operophtera brumata nucleopolyhedrovirus]
MASPSKRPRIVDLEEEFSVLRSNTPKSFEDSRLKVLSKQTVLPLWSKGVVYWMSRDCRVQDNWAMLFAQDVALSLQLPLHVCYCLTQNFLDVSMRQFHFLTEGLKLVEAECKELNISFHMLDDSGDKVLVDWIKEHEIGIVVCDFNPLNEPMQCVNNVRSAIPKNAVLVQVDAHNIVPCWAAYGKMASQALHFRRALNNLLPLYLTEFPPVVAHPFTSFHSSSIDWQSMLETRDVNKHVKPIEWATAGYHNAVKALEEFFRYNHKKYDLLKKKQDRDDVLGNLSPWLHFGQISAQRIMLYARSTGADIDIFIEEFFIRRELADNFCFYNRKYNKLDGAPQWAQKTLLKHKEDKRSYIYDLRELSEAETHDPLWNAAQLELVHTGKMHGFMHMYWAKKILEWTSLPQLALRLAIFFKNHYSIDGRDPRGYVSCMEAICGLHDKGFPERRVFGKIRYMTHKLCKRKFAVDKYISHVNQLCEQ